MLLNRTSKIYYLQKATQRSDEYYSLRFEAINRMRLLELQNTELTEQEVKHYRRNTHNKEEALRGKEKRQFEERRLALQNDFEESLQQAAR